MTDTEDIINDKEFAKVCGICGDKAIGIIYIAF